VILALKIAHVAFAAAWFGHKLLIPRDIHHSIRDIEGAGQFFGRMKRAERFGITAGVLTVASGLGLMYLDSGFMDAPFRIYLGLGAALAMFVVGAFVARPSWKVIEAGLSEEDPVHASAGVLRLRQAFMLENLLWLLALGTMVMT